MMKSGYAWMRGFLVAALGLGLASCGQGPDIASVSEPETKRDEAPVEPAQEPVAASLEGAPGGGMIVQKNVMVPMRDGVRLATDIFRPAAPGKYPVVLVRTPYGNESTQITARAQRYVKRGYVFAIQDCRGKYDSEGDWYGKRNEAQDGSDTITWLGTRSWSSGKVGMTGGSYLGMVQYWVADQENPYLKALVPMVAPTTLGRDRGDFDHIAGYAARESFRSNVGWMLSTDGRVGQADGQGDIAGVVFQSALKRVAQADYPRIFGRPMKWLYFLQNQRDGFWEEYFLRAAAGNWSQPIDTDAWWTNYEERYRKVNVPMLHVSGWYDCCSEPLIKMFQSVRKLAADPVARNNQQLLLGPWQHHWGQQKAGELDFGPKAVMDPDDTSMQWFDHWLKGEDNGVDRQKPVRVFVQGEGRWREADDWPIPGTQFTNFYLRSTGEARLAKGGGRLATEAPAGEPADSYTYDPGNPTPEILHATGRWTSAPMDRATLERRDDILVYSTETLRTPIEVTGPLRAVIYIATSAPSTDLFVRLIDVHPNGKAYPAFIAWTDPYQTHWSKEVETVSDGTRIIKAEVRLPATSILFQAGHRVRVEISSAAAPTFRGLNVAPEMENTNSTGTVAHQKIYHDAAHASHIVLPVIPR